jgi:hypothetical protein
LRCGRRAWMGSERRPIIAEIDHLVDAPCDHLAEGVGKGRTDQTRAKCRWDDDTRLVH